MGIRLFARQRPGLPEDGPLTPSLRAMSLEISDGVPASPAGSDVARLVDGLGIRVAFLPTKGSGVTPWRRRIVLDSSYQGEGQAESPAKIGLVAHELTHLLQRELNDPWYWPSGAFRASTRAGQRWIGDSTSYMEVLAYIVGWTVQIDLRAAGSPQPPPLGILADHLATLTHPDARNAGRYVLSLFPDNTVYRQNYRLESATDDGRVPAGGWRHWLGRCGFGVAALDQAESYREGGEVKFVSPADLEQILGSN